MSKTIKVLGSGPNAGFVSYSTLDGIGERWVYVTLESGLPAEFSLDDGSLILDGQSTDLLRIEPKDLTSILGGVG